MHSFSKTISNQLNRLKEINDGLQKADRYDINNLLYELELQIKKEIKQAYEYDYCEKYHCEKYHCDHEHDDDDYYQLETEYAYLQEKYDKLSIMYNDLKSGKSDV